MSLVNEAFQPDRLHWNESNICSGSAAGSHETVESKKRAVSSAFSSHSMKPLQP
jgi:hypothetical protein